MGEVRWYRSSWRASIICRPTISSRLGTARPAGTAQVLAAGDRHGDQLAGERLVAQGVDYRLTDAGGVDDHGDGAEGGGGDDQRRGCAR